jgi:hypothetical protein
LRSVAAITNSDGALPLAKRRLEDAVSAIADPQPAYAGGICRWMDSLYLQLREALRDRPQRHIPGWRAVTPCRLDALALLVEIDTAVRSWCPDGKGTTDRLHQLIGRGYRPQDVTLITGYSDRLQGWVIATTDLLLPEAKVYLRPSRGLRPAEWCTSRT